MSRASGVALGVDHAIARDLPYWLAIQNSTDPLVSRPGRWGSTFCSLARAVREEGYCVDESLATRTPEATARFADANAAVYESLLRIAESPASHRVTAISRELPKIYAIYAKWMGERRAPSASIEDVRAVISSDPDRPYRAIRSLFFPRCAEKTARNDDFEFSECRGELYSPFENRERASRRMHELLGKDQPMPVPFAYCANVLIDGKKYAGINPMNCGLHWSLVAGRKKIDGECHLLVRNSWSRKVEYSPDWKVEGGDIWVREKELLSATLLVQWLK
jgi:hypothetical protein